jgi:competence protein ComEA
MSPVTVSRSGALAGAIALLALLALAGQRLAGAGATEPAPPAAAIAPVAAAAPEPLVVHVVGAVRRPGLYRLAEGARVADAVARAGGATRGAQLAAVNLAAPLADGMQVMVPSRVAGAAGAAAGSTPGAGAAAPRVSLSSATVEQLDALPGVGPVTAQKIVDWRTKNGPVGAVDELDAIPGIGPATIERLRELVTP